MSDLPLRHPCQRALAGCALLCGLLALLAPTLVVASAPERAAVAWFSRDFDEVVAAAAKGRAQTRRDPWGNPWRVRVTSIRSVDPAFVSRVPHFAMDGDETVMAAVYSCGPNGVDERGQADDIFPTLSRFVPLAWLRESSLCLAALLLWWAACLRPARGSHLREAGLVVLMSAPAVALVVGLVLWANSAPYTRGLIPEGTLSVVPAPVAAAGTLVLGALSASLTLRLLGASEPSESPEPPHEDLR